MRNIPPWDIAIIGAGKVGLVLGKLLLLNKERIVALVSRTRASARAGGKFLRCRNVGTELSLIPTGTTLIFIAAPHGAIPGIVQELTTLDLPWKKITVCHASGMLTAEVLTPLSDRGAVTFSFHPLQTFPRDFTPEKIVPHARGIYYGVDGNSRAISRARQLARKLSAKIVEIPPELREYYHAACVVASNHLIALLSILEEMFGKMRGTRKHFLQVFEPIIQATLSNVKRSSPSEALSGPVARGGVETIKGHFESIREHSPGLLAYFARMTEETVYLASKKKSITDEQRNAMIELVESYRTDFTH